MDPVTAIHNSHLDGLEAFLAIDPQLRALRRQALIYEPPLIDRLPVDAPGVYTLGGARQIGKTTLLKQWMARLVGRGVDPRRMVFLTGEQVDDHHVLVRRLQEHLSFMPADGLLFVLLDEVTYIREWDRAVKFAADAGLLERVVLVATGSDLTIVREARSRFPGRRGASAEVDFHLYPLSFPESCRLRGVVSGEELACLENGRAESLRQVDGAGWDRVYGELQSYLLHGGFLTAMNDVAREGRALPATLATYSDWIRGDVLKRGKSEHYLREVLGAVIARLGGQVTWNALARDLSIDHPQTVADYVHLLAAMDALFVQPALLEDGLAAAPKKARKVMPTDPFIYHAIRAWLEPVTDPFVEQMRPCTEDPVQASALVELCVVTHARRHFPCYYVKAEGEVDLAIVAGGRVWPLEVKWRRQVRPKDLKQVAKYPQAAIAAPTRGIHELSGVAVIPVPVALCRLAAGRLPAPQPDEG